MDTVGTGGNAAARFARRAPVANSLLVALFVATGVYVWPFDPITAPELLPDQRATALMAAATVILFEPVVVGARVLPRRGVGDRLIHAYYIGL